MYFALCGKWAHMGLARPNSCLLRPWGGKIGLRVLGCRYKIVEGVADADYGFDSLAARFGFGRFYLCDDESVFWGFAGFVV